MAYSLNGSNGNSIVHPPVNNSQAEFADMQNPGLVGHLSRTQLAIRWRRLGAECTFCGWTNAHVRTSDRRKNYPHVRLYRAGKQSTSYEMLEPHPCDPPASYLDYI